MKKRFAVVLAAGQGTRMKSKLHKVLHPILDQPMIQFVLDALQTTKVSRTVTIVGFGAKEVMESIGEQTEYITQAEQLGTAHAVLQTEALLKNETGTTIVVCGDTPLITGETYEQLFEFHETSGSAATVLTTKLENPFGYGRIVRDENDEVKRIVEQKDADETEIAIDEINTGTYCFDNQVLFAALKEINNDNAQSEYYLTDIIEILRNKSKKVSAFLTTNADETIGINDRVVLAQAEAVMRARINEGHLRNGVGIIDPLQTYIGPNVTIEEDVIIHPGSIVLGESHIESGAVIGPNTEINDCHIGKASVIRQSVVSNSKIGNNANVGPFAHIRPETSIGNDVKVGNFVEVKKSTVGDHTKLPHLSYIGDATIGEHVNVGCGAITVNYDGVNKFETIIEDDVFVGCNANLVAPVTVQKGSFVAAGSTITKTVPSGALAIARAQQTNKEAYAKKINKRK